MSEKIKCREFPEIEFKTREEMFAHIKANIETVFALKRAQIKNSDSLPSSMSMREPETMKGNGLEKGFIYPVINTTLYMDSHNDVHLNGIWDISARDKSRKTFYLADHKLETSGIIAFPEDVEVFVKEMSWRSLGANYTGKTQALMFKVSEKKIRNEMARQIIDERIKIEHSIRMRYIKMFFAVDSDSPDYKQEKVNFDKYVGDIINSDRAKENGYFFGIEEAEIYKEGSMVIAGSNDITPMVYPKNTPDPSQTDSEDKADPSLTDSQKKDAARRRVY